MKTSVRILLSFSAMAAMTLAVTSCSLLELAVKRPEVKLDQVRVTNPGLRDSTLMFDLNVTNPNPTTLKVDGIDYKLVLNGKQFAEGVYDQVTELPGEQTVKVSLPIKVEYARVFDSLMSALQKPESQYMLQGSARLGIFTIPFSKDGTIKWQGE
ncbi:MAG: LEA type 2 family protein [Bdellovibrionaceae bacterium]|nr:LEA type 2 family protein [Pseudobdellovibrionaceae bacterium]